MNGIECQVKGCCSQEAERYKMTDANGVQWRWSVCEPCFEKVKIADQQGRLRVQAWRMGGNLRDVESIEIVDAAASDTQEGG